MKDDNQGDPAWEKGDNRALTIPAEGAAAVSVLLEWGGELAVEVTPAPPPPAVEERGGSGSERSGSDSEGEAGAITGSMTSSYDDSMALLPQWQGKELRFMRSNEHTRWAAVCAQPPGAAGEGPPGVGRCCSD